MENSRVDPCCPADPQQKTLWEEKLQKEKNGLILQLGEINGERESILKALGHSIRLAILYQLNMRANCVCELVSKLKAANSAISYHLSFLAKYSLIGGKNISGRTYYYVTAYGRKVLRWLKDLPLRDASSEQTEDKTIN